MSSLHEPTPARGERCEVCGASPREVIATQTGMRCFDAYACARNIRESRCAVLEAASAFASTRHDECVRPLASELEAIRKTVAALRASRARERDAKPLIDAARRYRKACERKHGNAVVLEIAGTGVLRAARALSISETPTAEAAE